MEEKPQHYAVSVGVVEKQQYPRISVVIPARNEAQNLHHVLPNIPSIVREVILVERDNQKVLGGIESQRIRIH